MGLPQAALVEALDRDGYIRLGHEFFESPDAETAKARAVFLESCSELPWDEAAVEANRRRRYGTFVLLPWSGTLESVPPMWDARRGAFVSRYVQAADLNPEQNGNVRVFAPLTADLAGNPFLLWLIRKAFGLVAPDFEGRPVWVGCHVIRLLATPKVQGRSSPDLVHRDGEPYTMAVLIDRTDVVGGENIIATMDAEGLHPAAIDPRSVLAKFTLESPWEGWMLCDERVAHYVSPVEARAGAVGGSRTVLLLDFTPMNPSPGQRQAEDRA